MFVNGWWFIFFVDDENDDENNNDVLHQLNIMNILSARKFHRARRNITIGLLIIHRAHCIIIFNEPAIQKGVENWCAIFSNNSSYFNHSLFFSIPLKLITFIT